MVTKLVFCFATALMIWMKVRWLPELQASELRSCQRLWVNTQKHAQ